LSLATPQCISIASLANLPRYEYESKGKRESVSAGLRVSSPENAKEGKLWQT
jgi:hypothetical protein